MSFLITKEFNIFINLLTTELNIDWITVIVYAKIFTMRNIMLVILPVFWPKMPPLGLGYLETYLLDKGIDVETCDLNNLFYNLSDDNLKKQWLISSNVSFESSILGIIKNNHAKQYNVAINRLLDFEAVGFSCFKSNFSATCEVVKILKSKRQDIKIILGGPEITRQFLKNSGGFDDNISRLIDLFVVGEGELPLYNFMRGEKYSVKIAEFEQLADLSFLSFPRYQNIDFALYPRRDAVALQSSRGCIRRCGFCSERLLYKNFRRREINSIIEEIKYHKKNGIKYFVFFDSLINADIGALEDLCDKIIGNFGSVNWEAQISIRDDMEQEIFEKIKKSGCYNLFVGLESGCDKTLKNMNKGFSVQDAVKFFTQLKKAGLFFGVSIIIGYPGETDCDFRQSLDFIVRNKNIIPKIEQVNPFTYYEGTSADRAADYKINKSSLRRMEIFIHAIKQHGFKYTNAFLGNLMEKNG